MTTDELRALLAAAEPITTTNDQAGWWLQDRRNHALAKLEAAAPSLAAEVIRLREGLAGIYNDDALWTDHHGNAAEAIRALLNEDQSK